MVDDSASRGTSGAPQHDSLDTTAPAGTTASAIPGTTYSRISKGDGSPTSALSVKSGVEGPYAQADAGHLGAQHSTTAEQSLPDRTTQRYVISLIPTTMAHTLTEAAMCRATTRILEGTPQPQELWQLVVLLHTRRTSIIIPAHQKTHRRRHTTPVLQLSHRARQQVVR